MNVRKTEKIVFDESKTYSVEDVAFNVIHGDWLKVARRLPEESIDLIVTSPPYNLGKDYKTMDDNKPFEEYLKWHKRVLAVCFELLKDGGRLAWQVGSIINGDGEYFPLHHWVSQTCRDLGYIMRCEIVWNKMQIPKRTAWGSWMSASNNKILPGFEYVEIFSKNNKKIQYKGEDTITRENFIKWTDGTWTITPETELCKEHPAPFPIELPRRIIEMNTYKGAVVLDPFCGIGTSNLAAKKLGRIPIGVEVDSDFCDKAIKRMNSEVYYEWEKEVRIEVKGESDES